MWFSNSLSLSLSPPINQFNQLFLSVSNCPSTIWQKSPTTTTTTFETNQSHLLLQWNGGSYRAKASREDQHHGVEAKINLLSDRFLVSYHMSIALHQRLVHSKPEIPTCDFDVFHAMAHPHYRSQFGDTTFTKVFVGGLAWETPTEEMRRYFEQFGEILEAVIIADKNTGKSKGYGFVSVWSHTTNLVFRSIWVRFSFLILNFGSDQCEYRWLFVILNPRGRLVLIQTRWSMEEEQIVTLLHWEGLDLHPLEVHFTCFRYLNIYRGWIRCGPQCECWQCIKRNPSSIMANFNFRLEMNKFNHVSFFGTQNW